MIVTGWQSKFTDEVKLFHFADDNFKGEYATELNPEIRIREEKIDQAIDTVVSLLDETLSEHVLAGFDGTDFTSPLKEIPEAVSYTHLPELGIFAVMCRQIPDSALEGENIYAWNKCH